MLWGRIISTVTPLVLVACVLAAVPAVLGGARRMVEPLSEGYPGSFGEGSSRQASGARKAVADAQIDVTITRRKLNRLHLDLERSTRNAPGWVEALLDAREARMRVESIRTPMLAQLNVMPEMQAKRIEIAHLETKLETARDAGESQRVVQIASTLMRLRADVRSMERQALAANEDLTDAMDDLVDANDRLREHWRAYQASLRSDPELQQTRVALAAAEARKREAYKQLAREQRENARQERDRLEDIVRVSFTD